VSHPIEVSVNSSEPHYHNQDQNHNSHMVQSRFTSVPRPRYYHVVRLGLTLAPPYCCQSPRDLPLIT